MARLDWLNQLIALGAKLPLLWPLILQFIDLWQQAYTILVGPPKLMGEESFGAVSDDEAAAEVKVEALLAGPDQKFGAIGDGSIIKMLRDAFALIQQYPALMQLIQLLIASWLKLPKPA